MKSKAIDSTNEVHNKLPSELQNLKVFGKKLDNKVEKAIEFDYLKGIAAILIQRNVRMYLTK